MSVAVGSDEHVRYNRRPTATEAVTLLAEIEEAFRQQGRMEAINAASHGQHTSVARGGQQLP